MWGDFDLAFALRAINCRYFYCGCIPLGRIVNCNADRLDAVSAVEQVIDDV